MTNKKILNTRVSSQLYEKISNKAKKNRTTVSSLIRNLVEDTLEIHDDIHEAVDRKIKKYLSEAERQNILGFQEVNLAKDVECDDCQKPLQASETAFFAFFEDRDVKAILCSACKSKSSKTKKTKSNESTSNT